MTPGQTLETPSARREAWWVVFSCFVCVVFVFGIPTVALPVLYSPIIDEFGWSRSQVTLIATMKFAAGALCAPLIGLLVDRFTIRRVVVGSSILVAVSMALFLSVRALWQLYALGVLLGLGSLGTMIATKVLVSRWFARDQGLAVGLALLGTSVAGSFGPILVHAVSERWGWRLALPLASLGVWFVALPIFARKGREGPARPEAAGFGAGAGLATGEAADIEAVVRQPSFWAMGFAVALIGFVDQGLLQHTVLYIEKDLGLGRAAAAQALSLVFATSVVGKVGFGWVFDRLSVRGVMICYLLMAAAVLLAFPVEGTFLLVPFSAVRGLAHGGTIVDEPILCKHTFGPRTLGRTIGLLTAFLTAGFALGPPVLGHLHDVQGDYHAGFFLLFGLSLAACLLLLGVRPAYRDAQKNPTGARPSTSAARSLDTRTKES